MNVRALDVKEKPGRQFAVHDEDDQNAGDDEGENKRGQG
jgi:hypothetical protein